MSERLFGTVEAAEYCGLTVAGLKWHIYVRKNLVPDLKVGQALVFRQSTLDAFNESRPKPGRPRKEQE